MLTRALVSRIVLLWLLHFFMTCSVLATPVPHPPFSTTSHLQPRDRYILRNNTLTGAIQAFNPVTRELLPQGPATDGGGKGLDASAAIWIAFTLVLGIPLSLAGIRGWRVTTGAGIGLAAAVCSWAAFVNTMNASGISDIPLSLIVLAFFALGFIFGLFNVGKIAGMILLGATGGLSFGMRCVLLRPGLLFHVASDGNGAGYALAWVLIAVLGFLGATWVSWTKYQRSGMLFACAANGTFLIALGVDLILNKQAGMGRGLIFLFDRNSSHIVDVMTKGYNPPTTALIILGTSLALIPVLAYVQHRIFKAPFDRRRISTGDSEFENDLPSNNSTSALLVRSHRPQGSKLFSGMWDGTLFRGKSPNRFSL